MNDGERIGLLETLAFAEKRAEDAEWRLGQAPHAMMCSYGSNGICSCYKSARRPSTKKNVVEMPAATYTAALFSVPCGSEIIKLAGTLDGFIDLATSGGTYSLSLLEAKALAVAICGAIVDVEGRCLFDRDALLLPHKGATE
jgi:hypothetical protein